MHGKSRALQDRTSDTTWVSELSVAALLKSYRHRSKGTASAFKLIMRFPMSALLHVQDDGPEMAVHKIAGALCNIIAL